MQVITVNKKASFDYFIIEKYETGIVLTGSEVKSLRYNTGSIKEAYITEKHGELWLTNCHIKRYSSSNEKNYNPLKDRKILVKKKEMYKLINATKKERMTIIPLSFFFNNKGIAKLSIGVGKGKKKYDKRAAIKKKEWNINKQRLEKNK